MYQATANDNRCMVFNVNSREKPDVYLDLFRCTEQAAPSSAAAKKNMCCKGTTQSAGVLHGGAGFFGEIQGPCGWKDSTKYSCCFTKCRSKWKTRLWPSNIYL